MDDDVKISSRDKILCMRVKGEIILRSEKQFSNNVFDEKETLQLTFIPERSFPTFSRSTGFLFHSFINV